VKISDFTLLDEEHDQAHFQQVVHDFNRTATSYPRELTIHRAFAAQAARTPDAPAVADAAGALTYRELDERSNRLAHFLLAQGIAPEDTVGVMLHRSAGMIVALLGILKAGGCYLPLGPSLPVARARYMLREARCRFLISEKSLIRTLNKLQWDCPALRGFLCLDSTDVRAEPEGVGEMMREEMWDYIRREVFDDISGGGWRSSYTGEWLSREVMDEYGDNILEKLRPDLGPEVRILEIGCASGISMFRLAPLVARYVGTDLSREIVRWSEAERERRGLANIRLEHLAAHEIDRLDEGDFDIVILNSVVQCFSGHNYLRDVLRKAIAGMRDRGILFLGNIWDQDLRDPFVESLVRFSKERGGTASVTKIDRSEELFLSRDFFEDLRHEFPEIAAITYSEMLGRHASELSEFGYDAVIRIEKGRASSALPPRKKAQFDAATVAEFSAGAVEERTPARALAYLIYTSGTSGQPKGVMVEHRSVLRLVRDTNYIRLGPDTRILQTGALAFDASTFEIWGALLNGGQVCLPPGEDLLDAQALGRLIERHGITTLFLTTSLFNVLVDADVMLFRGLETLLTGGERCSVPRFEKLRRAWPRLRILHVYGPTENTTFTTFYEVGQPAGHDIPIGRPIANTTVYILDEALRPLPVGVPGELCTGGDGLARGYLNDPALTREKFVPHPFVEGERVYRSGDLCRWLPDGSIEFLRRRDNQVKVRGFRIELEEIEACLARHEHVREALVLAKELVAGGSLELVAYVAGDGALDVEDLRGYAAASLPGYMVPGWFVALDRLPLNASGKIDRKALPDPRVASQDGAPSHVPPETETERQLAAIWEEVLGCRGIGATDDFFASGGHSLKVTQLIALVCNRMGVELPLKAVFSATTIREQARLLLDRARFGVEAIDEAAVLLNKPAGGLKIFAFPPGTGDALGYIQVAGLLAPHAFYGFNFIESENRIAHYADRIASVDPEGPHVLLGYSAGGNLAHHVAAEIELRGGRVSDIIMIDSSRRLGRLTFPPGEVEAVAAQFLSHESVRPYLTSPLLREKARRRIALYYDYIAGSIDDRIVGANIHVVTSEDKPLEHRNPATGELLASVPLWAEATRGVFRTYPASGEHNLMLFQPHLDHNVRLLRDILAVCRNGAAAHSPEDSLS
jgi:amino acid adenylation domain-containing protein